MVVVLRLGGTGVGAWLPRAAGIGGIRLSLLPALGCSFCLGLLLRSTFVIFRHFGIV